MWPEIESTKSGNKRELKLHGAAISERIDRSGLDSSIFDLVNLNLLNISDTSLKNLPPQISNLTNLQTILLFGNELTELPQCIGKLDKLKVLDVSRNKLASLPQEMSELSNLTTVNLSNNELGKSMMKILWCVIIISSNFYSVLSFTIKIDEIGTIGFVI